MHGDVAGEALEGVAWEAARLLEHRVVTGKAAAKWLGCKTIELPRGLTATRLQPVEASSWARGSAATTGK